MGDAHVLAYLLLGGAAALVLLPIALVVMDGRTLGEKLSAAFGFAWVLAVLVGFPVLLLSTTP